MGKHRILVVDDDHDILELLAYNLEREGFIVKTLDRSTGVASECKAFDPELIILDIMMPDKNGIEVCREIRAIDRFRDTYIFFLSAKSERYYQQAAFDTGGDEFIEKIIGLGSLTFKIKTVLKRKLIIRKRFSTMRIGQLYIDRKSMSVSFGNREIRLSIPEFELLFFFAQNSRKIIKVDNFLLNAWGLSHYTPGNSIEVYVERLIEQLGSRWIYKVADGKYTLLPE
jgi:two-component system alkaline phosphatase synthesis response regulator PhoP